MLKTTLAALVLALAPAIAGAACFDSHSEQAMSCADGSVWDTEKAACVEVTA